VMSGLDVADDQWEDVPNETCWKVLLSFPWKQLSFLSIP
jgi:hypothetical protein